MSLNNMADFQRKIHEFQIDVLSIMDKLELEYQDPDDRWWKLRAEMAGQKYAITKRALDATKCPACNGDLNERGNCSQCHTLYPSCQ